MFIIRSALAHSLIICSLAQYSSQFWSFITFIPIRSSRSKSMQGSKSFSKCLKLTSCTHSFAIVTRLLTLAPFAPLVQNLLFPQKVSARPTTDWSAHGRGISFIVLSDSCCLSKHSLILLNVVFLL